MAVLFVIMVCVVGCGLQCGCLSMGQCTSAVLVMLVPFIKLGCDVTGGL